MMEEKTVVLQVGVTKEVRDEFHLKAESKLMTGANVLRRLVSLYLADKIDLLQVIEAKK